MRRYLDGRGGRCAAHLVTNRPRSVRAHELTENGGQDGSVEARPASIRIAPAQSLVTTLAASTTEASGM